jgi:hypothetical protein
MKIYYEGTQTLSFEGVLMSPGLNQYSKEHAEKLNLHPKFVAMKKEGVVKDVETMTQKQAAKAVESGEATIPAEAVEADVKVAKKKK